MLPVKRAAMTPRHVDNFKIMAPITDITHVAWLSEESVRRGDAPAQTHQPRHRLVQSCSMAALRFHYAA
ncbi:hypothetical protein EB241_16170 [Erwinia psidii]|uniref:Uncharacterized protein n=1 Tax=Erwinia psidii TaxID=69224 RepID=A0A3N6TPQ3_9GAMM|nr:hypothetical protein EB241_16170 [Erwinia psidii]